MIKINKVDRLGKEKMALYGDLKDGDAFIFMPPSINADGKLRIKIRGGHLDYGFCFNEKEGDVNFVDQKVRIVDAEINWAYKP